MLTEENLEYFNKHKTCNCTDAAKLKITKALEAKNYKVKVEWDYTVLVKGNKRILVTCLSDGNQVYRSANDLSRGLYECSCCVLSNWKRLAESKNYTLLERSGKENLRIQCRTCSCVSERSITNLLGRNEISCLDCQENRYKKCAEACNMEYISYIKSRNSLVVTVKCNDCGNVHTTTNSTLLSLQKNNCPACKIAEISQNADRKGWLYTKTIGTNNFITCKICNFVHQTTTNIINSKSNIVCHNCRLNRYKAALADKDCIYIKTIIGPKGKTVISFLNPSNEVMSADISAVLAGKFATSEDNHWKLPYQLYLISTEINNIRYTKIGLAQYAELRAKTLKISGSYEVEVLYTFKDRWGAFEAEQYLHNVFNAYKIGREEAATFTSNVILGRATDLPDGSTEWFRSVDRLAIKKEFKDKYDVN